MQIDSHNGKRESHAKTTATGTNFQQDFSGKRIKFDPYVGEIWGSHLQKVHRDAEYASNHGVSSEVVNQKFIIWNL
jgi:hypothetical protein